MKNSTLFLLNGGGQSNVSLRSIACLTFIFLAMMRTSNAQIFLTGGNLSSYIGAGPTQLPPGGTLPSTVIYSCGTLNIDVNYSFIGSTINMCPGAAMEVLPNVTLSILSTTVQADAAYNELWHRIRVQTDARLILNTSTSLGNIPSVLRDAEFAVEVMDDGILAEVVSTHFVNNWIGIFKRKSSSYVTANLGVVLFNGNRFEQTAQLLPIATWIADPVTVSVEQGGATIIPNGRAIAGVALWNLGSFDFGIMGGGMPAVSNVFEGLDNGIIANICGMRIHNCTFRHIRWNNYPLGHINHNMNSQIGGTSGGTRGCAVYHNGDGESNTSMSVYSTVPDNFVTFTDCNTGINCLNASNAEVRDCNLEQIVYLPAGGANVNSTVFGTAIFVRNLLAGNFPNVSGNFIRAERSGINFGNVDGTDPQVNHNNIGILTYSPPLPGLGDRCGIILNGSDCQGGVNGDVSHNTINIIEGRDGIRLNASSNWSVYENPIDITVVNNTWLQSGIFAQLSLNCSFDCNEVTGTAQIPANGQKMAFRIENGQGCDYSCNSSENTPTGFSISNVPSGLELKGNDIGGHWRGLYVDNSSIYTQYHNGNRWLGGNYPDYAAFFNTGIVNNNLFYIDNTQFFLPLAPPPSDINVSGWFTPDFGSDFVCPASCASLVPFAPEEAQSLDYQIAMGDLNFPTFEEYLNWNADKALYDKILDNPEIAPSGSMLDAFKDQQAQTTLGELGDIGHGKKEMRNPAPTDQQLQGALYLLFDNINAEYISVLGAMREENADIPSLEAQRISLKWQLNYLLAEINGLQSGISSALLSAAQSLYSDNSQVTANGIAEENQKIVNEIYFTTVGSGNIEFSEAQLQALFEVAVQCPITGGDAVYEARGLYWLTHDYDFEDVCIAPQARVVQMEQVATTESMKVMPNPAQSDFGILLGEAYPESVMVELIDPMGQVLQAGQIAPGNRLGMFDCTSLSNGTYCLRTSLNGAQIGISRLVVIH